MYVRIMAHISFVGLSGKLLSTTALKSSGFRSTRRIWKVCEANPSQVMKSLVWDFLLQAIIHFIFCYFGLGSPFEIISIVVEILKYQQL